MLERWPSRMIVWLDAQYLKVPCWNPNCKTALTPSSPNDNRGCDKIPWLFLCKPHGLRCDKYIAWVMFSYYYFPLQSRQTSTYVLWHFWDGILQRVVWVISMNIWDQDGNCQDKSYQCNLPNELSFFHLQSSLPHHGPTLIPSLGLSQTQLLRTWTKPTSV